MDYTAALSSSSPVDGNVYLDGKFITIFLSVLSAFFFRLLFRLNVAGLITRLEEEGESMFGVTYFSFWIRYLQRRDFFFCFRGKPLNY